MEDFFRELRALRVQAGLSIDELAEHAHFPADTLAAAETGPQVPPNPVVVAFARACGAPVGEWEDRWRAAVRAAKTDPAVDDRETGTRNDTRTGAQNEVQNDTEAGAVAAAPGAAAAAAGAEPAPAAGPVVGPVVGGRRSRHRLHGRGRLSRGLAVGIAVGALLVGGSVALLARPLAHMPPRAARPPAPKPRFRPAPVPSRSPAPRVAVWPEVGGVGCPHTSRAAVTLDGATQGPPWQGAGGGWAGNGCDGSSVWTMDPNGRELHPSALSWFFSRRGRVSVCTLSVFVPAQNALGQADYTIYEGSASFGSVTIDQAAVAGQWVTLDTVPAPGQTVEIRLVPVVASLTALDYGRGPGRPPHGHNVAIAASAAAMTCT